MKAWSNIEISDNFNKKHGQQIQKWLGDKSPDKIRLTRLLLARLTWDWKSYEKLQHGSEYKDIELQACRMDICHYAFPKKSGFIITRDRKNGTSQRKRI